MINRAESIRIINAGNADTDAAQWPGMSDAELEREARATGWAADNDSGWQIGITRADADPDDHAEDEWPTEAEEREAMIAAGIEPEERIDDGVWIASIPKEWARAAEAELRGEPGESEPGTHIQECQPHTITGWDGRRWTIEIPTP